MVGLSAIVSVGVNALVTVASSMSMKGTALVTLTWALGATVMPSTCTNTGASA